MISECVYIGVKHLKGGASVTERELFETYKETVFKTCYYMLQDYQEAEDLTQNVFIKIFNSNFQEIEKLKPWILTVTTNMCLNHVTRKKRPMLIDKLVDLYNDKSSSHDVEKKVIQLEFKTELQLLLSSLPEKTRNVIILKYLHELKNAEVAKILDVPEGTVKSACNYGLKVLRKKVDRPNLQSFLLEG